MRPSSSPSDLFGPLSGDARVDRELTGPAWLAAMLEVERALARVQAGLGLIPADAATAIADACRADLYDLASIAQRGKDAANPVVPLVKDIRAHVRADAAQYVHFGATSQDILDTAAVLVSRRALVPIREYLAATADTCASLADTHRDTVMVGRTLMQHALPTTFGLKCAGWMVSLDQACAGLDLMELCSHSPTWPRRPNHRGGASRPRCRTSTTRSVRS
jgi:3-carboxy-cis,cis-muconate cycloisomerase